MTVKRRRSKCCDISRRGNICSKQTKKREEEKVVVVGDNEHVRTCWETAVEGRGLARGRDGGVKGADTKSHFMNYLCGYVNSDVQS